MKVNLELNEFYANSMITLIHRTKEAAGIMGFRNLDQVIQNFERPRHIGNLAASLIVLETFLSDFEKFAKKSNEERWLDIMKDPHFEEMLDATKKLSKHASALDKIQMDLLKLSV